MFVYSDAVALLSVIMRGINRLPQVIYNFTVQIVTTIVIICTRNTRNLYAELCAHSTKQLKMIKGKRMVSFSHTCAEYNVNFTSVIITRVLQLSNM